MTSRRSLQRYVVVGYIRQLSHLLGQDWANDRIRPHLQIYPEIADRAVSEIWHGGRLLNLDPSMLTPMYIDGIRHYYVGEVCQLSDGTFIIPIRWLIYQKTLHAQAYRLFVNSVRLYSCY